MLVAARLLLTEKRFCLSRRYLSYHIRPLQLISGVCSFHFMFPLLIIELDLLPNIHLWILSFATRLASGLMCYYKFILPSPTISNQAARGKTYGDEQNKDGDGNDKADDKLGRPT